jgi:nucleotidyltransferase/DNA polymerase involved in DNA repair
MDEAWIDVTAAAAAAAAAQPAPRFVGHVHAAAAAVAAHNRYRPMDLSADVAAAHAEALALAPACGSDALLAAGSVIAAQVRAALRSEIGLRASAGIAHNKLLAKLVSGASRVSCCDALTNNSQSTPNARVAQAR